MVGIFFLRRLHVLLLLYEGHNHLTKFGTVLRSQAARLATIANGIYEHTADWIGEGVLFEQVFVQVMT